MGSAYYIISLLKVLMGTPFFPFVFFIISTVITFMSGNGLISAAVIIPILGGDASAIAAIIEGSIAGELLSPYSPTAIMVCSIFKINTVKHSASIFPYVGTAVLASALLGFMLSGLDLPVWILYLVIFLFFLLVMFKKPIK